MKLFRSLIVLVSTVPLACAANKDMIELQREVMTLQDQVRQINEKLITLTAVMQGITDNTKQSNVSILAMQDRLADSLKKQQEGVTGPVLGVGQKLEQMSDDFRAVREAVLDMNSRFNKLDAKITDLGVVVQTMKSPAAPPPGAIPEGSNGGANPGSNLSNYPPPTSAAGPLTPPPGMKADAVYTNAYRDYIGGNYDLAMQQFTDILKYFPTAAYAPNAQYYVGDIYYKRKDYDNAIQSFDAVLEHFSDNPRTPDAHLMKGRSLQALGKRDAAGKEYKEIVARYPDTDAAAKAKTLLKELGLSASSTPAKAKARRKR
jgi:tol-pal system protein YbgF